MNHVKTLLVSAAFALAIPVAHAQNAPAQERGIADCAIQLTVCLASTKNLLACGIAFAKCMITGGNSAALAAGRSED